MEEVERFARSGGPVLGICNGFQVLCEAGLLPGALLPNTSLRFLCRQVGVTVASVDTAWTGECTPGERALDPRQAHDRPLLRARAGARRARGASARSPSATRPGRTRTARRATSPASPTQAGNVVGLMPHPEHAVDPLTGLGGRPRAVPLRRRPPRPRWPHDGRHPPPRARASRDAEYDRIVEHMEREPNEVELAVFSLMWSEHCAYKHSKQLLRSLPDRGPARRDRARARTPARSRSAVASRARSRSSRTTTRARSSRSRAPPPASAGSCATSSRSARGRSRSSTRCASARSSAPRARATCSSSAVAGIGHYGNSIGVATVGGEIYFEDAYEQNCLVNAMCLGLIDEDRLIRSAAAGVGNVVLLFGARTGRDGIGGASVLASAELDELDAAKRPTVQIGDPFEEKKLLECSLELLDRDLLVALQDLGAAGLTSSSAEMASKGEVGIDIDVRKVPLREADMEAFEIMISESQERMLCVVEPDRVDEVVAVCEKWLVNATAIGEVTGHAAAAGVRRRRARRRHAGHRAGRRVPALRPRAGRARGLDVPAAARRSIGALDARRTLARAAAAAPTSRRAAGRSSSTTASSARAPCAAPSRPTPRCSRCRAAPRSPSRSTATAAASPATRTAARSRPCSSARPTSPASAPSRSG